MNKPAAEEDSVWILDSVYVALVDCYGPRLQTTWQSRTGRGYRIDGRRVEVRCQPELLYGGALGITVTVGRTAVVPVAAAEPVRQAVPAVLAAVEARLGVRASSAA